MKPSSDLYALIHALSSTEKNYIKKYAGVYSKNKNNYYKLLEAIYKQDEYDEKALLIKFRKESFVKHFAVTKNQLMELILKLLRQFHQKNSIHATINAATENARLLYERGLSTLAFKQLDKAQKLAEEHHIYSYSEEVLDLKRHFITQMQAYDWREEIEVLLQEKETILEAELEYVSYARTYYQLLFLMRENFVLRTEEETNKIEAILPNGELAEPKYPNYFYSQLFYLNNKNAYSVLHKDTAQAISIMRDIITLWEKHPKLIQSEPERYMAALNNYAISLVKNNEPLDLEYLNNKTDLINQDKPRTEALVFESSMLWRITNTASEREYDQLILLVEEIESTLPRLKDNIQEVRYFMLTRYTAYFHFMWGNYHQALKQLETTLALKQLDLRQDLQMFSNMLYLFIHYHLGNNVFLYNAIKNYRRKIKKKGLLYDLEDFQLRLLSKLCNVPDKTMLQKQLDAFQKELKVMTEKNPTVVLIMQQHLNLNEWIESLRQNCTVIDFLKKNPPKST
jgi:hypothetical protein